LRIAGAAVWHGDTTSTLIHQMRNTKMSDYYTSY
jgi:hypothetical protein